MKVLFRWLGDGEPTPGAERAPRYLEGVLRRRASKITRLSRVPFSRRSVRNSCNDSASRLRKFVAARLQVRHITGKEIVAACELNTVAREVKGCCIARRQLVETVLPSGC